MNKLLTNLAQAKSNPHVFWPLIVAAALRIVPPLVFKALDIYAPQLVGKDAMMQDMLEPYLRDAIQALTSYGGLAAATAPAPANQPPPPTTTNPT